MGVDQLVSSSVDRETDVDWSGSKNSLSNGNQATVGIGHLADQSTLEIEKAKLSKPDGQATSSSINLIIATLDNSGGFTSRTTIISGDGSTVFDDETGTPLASWQNTTGSGQTVAVLIDNGSGSSEDVYGEAKGAVT